MLEFCLDLVFLLLLFSTRSVFCWNEPSHLFFGGVSIVLGIDCCLNQANGFHWRFWGYFPLLPSIRTTALLSLAANCRAKSLSSSWEQLNLLANCLVLGWGQSTAPCLPMVNGPTMLTWLHGHITAICFNSIVEPGGTWESLAPLSAQGSPGTGWGWLRHFPAWSWAPARMEMAPPAKAGLPWNFLPLFFITLLVLGLSASLFPQVSMWIHAKLPMLLSWDNQRSGIGDACPFLAWGWGWIVAGLGCTRTLVPPHSWTGTQLTPSVSFINV